MSILTAQNLIDAFTEAKVPVEWAETGGNCRAIRVRQPWKSAGDRHVLITYPWDPFTDDDLTRDASGPLAFVLYRTESDEGPYVLVDEIHSGVRAIETAVSLFAKVPS